jgi:peptide/nickel transport system substrate-binding protein
LVSKLVSIVFAVLLSTMGFIPAVASSTSTSDSNGSTLYVGVTTTSPEDSLSALGNQVDQWINPDTLASVPDAIFQLPYFFAPANNTFTGILVNSVDTFVNNNTYIVHLNNNTGWSNGTPVNAWDFFAEMMVDAALGAPAYTTTVINNYTVSIVVPDMPSEGFYGLSQSSFIFGPDAADTQVSAPYNQWKPIIDDIAGNLSQLQAGNQTVLTSLETLMFAYTVANPIYSGPYYPTAASPSEIVLSKNPYYADANKLPINQIVVYQFTSANALYQYLDSGQLSVYFTYGGSGGTSEVPSSFAANIPSYMEQVDVQGYGGPSLTFNNDSAVVSNLNVREAIAYAINRTQVAQAGGSVYSALQYPIGMPDWMAQTYCTQSCLSNMNPYSFNLTAASNAMTAAGYTLQSGIWTSKNGTQATVTLLNTVSTDPTWVDIGLDVQTQLQSFGINVNLLNPSNPGSYETSGTGFDIIMLNWGYWLTAWDMYRNVAWFNGYPYPDMHFTANVTIPINGIGKVNPITLTNLDLNGAVTTADELNYTQGLAWLVDHYLPYLPLASQAAEIFANTQQFNWPNSTSPLWSAILTGDITAMTTNFEVHNVFSAATATSTSTAASSTAAVSTVTSTVVSTAVSTTVSTSVQTNTVTAPAHTDYTPIIAAVAIVIVALALVGAFMFRRRPGTSNAPAPVPASAT